MSPAGLSLLALIVALGVSMTSRVNVGWLGFAFAWLIGVYAAGLRPDAVLAGFPVALFVTLTGITLLFAIAETNGTLEALAHRAIRAARGNDRAIPILFFLIACTLSSVGPGAVSTVAILAPVAMVMGARAGVSPLLTALMVANGANAGNLSPFSSVGVIANSAMAKAGLAGYEGRVWFANFAAHVLVGAAAYLWLVRRQAAPAETAAARGIPAAEPRAGRPLAGGPLAGGPLAGGPLAGGPLAGGPPAIAPLTPRQKLTLLLVAAWIAGVLGLGVSLGLSAFAAAAILLVAGAGDESAAVKRVPWAVVMMVCGVSVLIGLLERTGGMDLFTDLLAKTASAATLNGVIAFVTGAISIYSSTSGVVLPTFLPTASTLVDKVGGGNPLAVALSINVGASLVDVSPLSTIGALCVAAVSDPVVAHKLFRVLLIWGMTMTLVGALWSQLFSPLLAR